MTEETATLMPPEDPTARAMDYPAEWLRVQDLVAAFERLAPHEPKMAATALGKAYEAAKAWSRRVDPKGED